jgi:hypothetical protein
MLGGSTYSLEALQAHRFIGVTKPKRESRNPHLDSHQVRS